MALKLYDEADIQNIADEIRAKGVSGTFKVSDMADAIFQISCGSANNNIHDSSKDIANEYIEPDGTIKSYTGWSRSDYLEIQSGANTVISTNLTGGYCCYFDSNKSWISGFNLPISEIPQNAKYLIVSAGTPQMNVGTIYTLNLEA
jgi:hypothetical protein